MELDSVTNPHGQTFARVPLPLLARVDVHDSRCADPVTTAWFCFILTSELVPAGQLICKRHSTCREERRITTTFSNAIGCAKSWGTVPASIPNDHVLAQCKNR